jgi:hypothetical protein
MQYLAAITMLILFAYGLGCLDDVVEFLRRKK